MPCKNCKKPKIEQVVKLALEEGEKKYTFPKYGLSVIAKTLSEAQKKVKIMLDYKNKSI